MKTIPDEAAVFTIGNGRFEVGIAPGIGGSLTHFSEQRADGKRHWFRPAPATAIASGNVLGMAHFPLVPVSGRITGGVLNVNGQRFELPLNDIDTGLHYLHGEGWSSPWRLTGRTSQSARMELAGPVSGWPFRYHAWQDITVLDDGLRISMGITNTDDRRWPAGIGLHPWFPPPMPHLRARVDQVWLTDETLGFDRIAPVPDRWNFSEGRSLAGSQLVNGFSGWDGEALLIWDHDPARMQIRAIGALQQHLMIYTLHPSGAWCIEPVSHAVDGFNLASLQLRNDTGTALLEPGQGLQGEASFRLLR